jgi:hypothetical protein
MSVSPSFALTEFRSTSKQIGALQGSLATLSLLSGAAACYLKWADADRTPYLIATLLMAIMFPFTALVVLPKTYKKLEDKKLEDNDAAKITSLMNQFINLHTVRTLATLASAFIWQYYA